MSCKECEEKEEKTDKLVQPIKNVPVTPAVAVAALKLSRREIELYAVFFCIALAYLLLIDLIW